MPMAEELTAAEAKRLRQRNDWSLQHLANLSGINKAYLSEFETGQRSLAPEQLESLKSLLIPEASGRASPSIIVDKGHYRLVFVDPATGEETDRPPIAHIKWTDESGSSYSMYVGEP